MQISESKTHESLLIDLSAKQLRAFVTVADTLSYVEAAAILHYTEPGVFAKVKRLEELLGCKLFERNGRGVRLAPAGQALLETCRATLSHFERIETVRERLLHPRQVTIAAGIATGSYLLPALIQEFARSEPSIGVELVTAPAEEVMDLVAAGNADLAVSGGINRLPLPPPLVLETLVDETYCLLRAPGFVPPPGPVGVYVLPRDPQLVEGIGRYLVAVGITAYELRSLPSTDAIKGACAAGLGYGLLPRRAALLELRAERLQEVEGLPAPFTVHVCVCHPPEAAMNEQARAFLRFLLAGAARIDQLLLRVPEREEVAGDARPASGDPPGENHDP